MILEQKPVESCAQCATPLRSSAGVAGCLNCLLNAGLDEPGARRFQHYEVELADDKSALRELGRGAMGVTYRARDLNLDSPVALKVINAHFSTRVEARDRFRREARLTAQLRHPNVASVFHFGETENGRCFYVMELVEGETLEAKVRREGSLGAASVLEIALQITRALVAAEKLGLVHRDLKPSNIMIAGEDESAALHVKVIDFGLAKLAAEFAPEIGMQFSGTLGFASPEQLQSPAPRLDTRSDIYSLGATLTYALVGAHAFTGTNDLAKAKAPPCVIELIRAMVARDPAARPQSARQLLVRLQDCQRAAGVKTRRPKYLAGALALALAGLAVFSLTKRAAHHPAPEKSIAVLPFANLSDAKENGYFASGLQDDLLSKLARIADLKVTSRTSVLQYASNRQRNLREIGNSLGVATVVEGSVQRIGNRVRVVAQLIDARRDTHLWGQIYDRDLSDTFAIEDEIAQQIAQQLQAKISPAERSRIEEKPTSDLTAYGFYTRALSLDITDDQTEEKIALLEQAVARDPDFIVARCFLARLYDLKYAIENLSSLPYRRKYSDLAQSAIDQALHLRPDRGEPRLALAYHDFISMHYAEARAELKIAEPLLPNNAAAIFLDARLDRRENRWDDALIKARRAFELDPHHEFYIEWIAQSYGLLRRYDEGENFVREARARNPALADRLNGPLGNLALDRGDLAAAGALTSKEVTHDDFATHFCAAYFARDYARALKIVAAAKAEFVEKEMGLKSPQSLGEGLVFLHQGLSAKATAIFRVQRRLDDQGIGPESRNEWYYSSAALDDAHLGKKEQAIAEARKALDLHPLAVDPIDGAGLVKQLALVYAALGEIDPALEQLQILVKIPSNINYGELRSSPDWDALRGDPRFEKLIAESRQPVAGR